MTISLDRPGNAHGRTRRPDHDGPVEQLKTLEPIRAIERLGEPAQPTQPSDPEQREQQHLAS
jgi:hypothetical protein